jgi:hypothetical protein
MPRGPYAGPRATRWHKVEKLLDLDDVAAANVVRFRRSPQAKDFCGPVGRHIPRS